MTRERAEPMQPTLSFSELTRRDESGSFLEAVMRLFPAILRCACAGILSICLGVVAATAGAKGDSAEARDALFAGTNVPRIRIDISRAGIAALGQTGWGNGQARPSVKARVREGSVVYTNVAIHLKGAAGSFRSVDDHPCFTLNFDKFAPGQSFHGLHKLSLNNSVQDPSYLSEKICRELFDAAGVPVPRAGHATVELNGRSLGLYVLLEGANKQFLKRYFTETGGNLYDGGFLQDISPRLSLNSGDSPRDHAGLQALIGAAREPDPARRLERLEQSLDVDRFLSYLAMDVMLCDWDGYAMNRNNWRVFHDRAANKMVFIPHGLDQMFGVDRATPECPILPPMQGMVARAVLGTPDGRRRYFERMTQLYSDVFHARALVQRVDDLAAVIRPVIVASDPQAARRHDQAVQWLKSRIARRDESLRQQLGALATRPAFDSNGTMRLTGWTPGKTQSGNAAHRQEQGPDGVSLLYITAASANTVASWRTRVVLDPGNYRFEGRIRTREVRIGSGEPAGARLRISRGTAPSGLAGTTDWRRFVYPVRVAEGGPEVEFVCELRASRGEAWFDTSSLMVVKLR
jgi:spore coat protein H